MGIYLTEYREGLKRMNELRKRTKDPEKRKETEDKIYNLIFANNQYQRQLANRINELKAGVEHPELKKNLQGILSILEKRINKDGKFLNKVAKLQIQCSLENSNGGNK